MGVSKSAQLTIKGSDDGPIQPIPRSKSDEVSVRSSMDIKSLAVRRVPIIDVEQMGTSGLVRKDVGNKTRQSGFVNVELWVTTSQNPRPKIV